MKKSTLPVPRRDDDRHALRPHLLQRAESEPEARPRRPEGRRHSSRRPHLARDVYAVRPGLFRRRDVSAGTDRESVRLESVTHVPGIDPT